MYRIFRERFQEAIEAGISAAQALPKEAREALRQVGREATEIEDNFYLEGGCPLVQAGLYSSGTLLQPLQWGFVGAYDESIKAAFNGEYPFVFEVVDR